MEKTQANRYDGGGYRRQLSSSLGTVAYEYDELGRLSLVRDESSQALAYIYDERNLLTRFHPPGLATPMTYEYDELGQATTVTGPGSQYHYSYDAAGNLLTATQSLTPNTTGNGTTTYAYDDLNRMIGWDGPYGSDTFTYDAAGRKISDAPSTGSGHTYTYDDAGQLLNDGGQDYTYDERGNQLTAGPETYTYDGLNRLVQVTPDLYGIQMSISFEVDGMGRKLKRTSGPANGGSADAAGVTQGLTFHYPDGGLNVLWKESDHGLERFRYLSDAYQVTVRETESQIGLPTVNTWLGYNGRGDVGYLLNAAGQAIGNFSYAPQNFDNAWQVGTSAGVTNRGTGFRGQVLPRRGPGLSRPLYACPPDTSGPIGYTAAAYTGDVNGWTSVVGEIQATYHHYQTLSDNETTTHTCRTQTGTEDVVDPMTGEVTGTRPVYSYQDYQNTGCNSGPPFEQCTGPDQSWVNHNYGECSTYSSEMNARTWSHGATAYTVPSGAVDWPGGSLTPTCEPQLDKLVFNTHWDESNLALMDQYMAAQMGYWMAGGTFNNDDIRTMMYLQYGVTWIHGLNWSEKNIEYTRTIMEDLLISGIMSGIDYGYQANNWYNENVSPIISPLELDRFKQFPIQVGYVTNPHIPKSSIAHIETWYTSTDIYFQLGGRVDIGDPNGTRIDNSRVTVRSGGEDIQTEFYGDWRSVQFGGVIKTPSLKLTDTFSMRSKYEIAGKPLPPLNYQVASGIKSESTVEPFTNSFIKIEPAIVQKTTIHGGPTALTGVVLVGVGIAVAPEVGITLLPAAPILAR